MRKTTSALAAAILGAGSAVVLSVAVPGIASATSCDPTTVTNLDDQGWVVPGPDTAGGGSATFVGDNLELAVPGTAGRAQASYPISTEGVPLSAQTAQSNYAVTGETNVSGFSYQLTMDLNRASNPDDTTGSSDFATLVYEPSAYGDTGVWYSTRELVGTPNQGGHGRPWNGTLAQISAAYPDAGIQEFHLQVGAGAEAGTAKVDTVKFGCNVFDFEKGNAAPTVDFTFNEAGDNNYRTFRFDATAADDGSVLTYAWNFGDGTTSTEVDPAHTFPAANQVRQVSLTVTDAGGKTATATHNVSVSAPGETVQGSHLPTTGADVMTLAAIAGIVLISGGAGLAVTRKRRARHSA